MSVKPMSMPQPPDTTELTREEDSATRTGEMLSLVWLAHVINANQGQIQDYDLNEA